MLLLLATLVDASPSPKDAVIAEVGAGAAIVGLVLVFLGVLVTTYQTLKGQVKKDSLRPLQGAAWVTLGVFLFGLISVATGTAWLIAGGGSGLYRLTEILFFAQLAGLVVAAVYATRVLLR